MTAVTVQLSADVHSALQSIQQQSGLASLNDVIGELLRRQAASSLAPSVTTAAAAAASHGKREQQQSSAADGDDAGTGGGDVKRARSSLEQHAAAQVIDFMDIIGALKTTKRTGWVNNRIDLPESIADHMYRMSVLAMLLEQQADAEPIERDLVVKMALAHDMCEAIAGDITPYCGVAEHDKHQREREAMECMRVTLGDSAAGREFRDLWAAYEAAATPEARVLKDLDKFEMIVTAFEYERAQGKDLESFFASTVGRFKNAQVRAWVDELCRRRASFRNERAAVVPQAHP